MTMRWAAVALRTASLGALLAGALSSTAWAQDEPQAADDESGLMDDERSDAPLSEDEPEEPSAEAAEDAEAEAEKPSGSDHETLVSAIGLEHLGGPAYPATPVRGIHGGSLWLTMHGLQWPYMPRLAGEPSTRIGFSGNAWVDTSYRDVTSGQPEIDPSLEEYRQQARVVFRVTPTYNANDDWFVQSQAEVALNGASGTSFADTIVADDLYVRVGRWNKFDLTAGRFQGWEVYHLGMGLDLFTVERDGARTNNERPVDIYLLSHFWDRPNGPGRLALHYYPTEYLRFELLGQFGGATLNVLGVRPVAILDLGIIKAKAGMEYGEETPREQSADREDRVVRQGVGGALQLVLDPYVEAGVSVAQSVLDRFNAQGVLDAAGSTTTWSYGGFVNARVLPGLLVGGGVNYTDENNLKVDVTGELNDIRTHLQVFGAVQYALWDQLFIKLVVAHANAYVNQLSDPPPVTEFRNKMMSARLRLMMMY